MPIFYKGASPGTHWHIHDATSIGFTSRSPGMLPDADRVMQHISRGNDSPYISLTRSYGVAYSYAVAGAASSDPGYVYEVAIDDPVPGAMQVLDPVKVVAASSPSPLASVPYQHDGLPEFLISVVAPGTPVKPCVLPQGGNTPRPPNLSIQLETLVRALRDAEVLATIVYASCVIKRIPVW